jgi:DedD protein
MVSGAANDVSNSHEPSYYEIALTNRQVIVAFVLLLLCLIAAFFSGVWIGRESGARMAAEQMVRNAPPPEEKKEGQNLEELQFFDQTKKGKGGKPAETRQPEPAPSAPAPAPPAAAQSTAQATPQIAPPKAGAGTDPTLGNDLGEDTEAAPRAPKPTPAIPATSPASPTSKHQKPTPVPTPAKASTPAPEKVAQAKPAQETPAAGGAAKTPKKAAETAAEPAHAAGQVVIQVFSSAEKDQAVRIRDRLVGGGQKAYLSPVEVAGRTMYRVRIGPFNSRDQAQKVAEQVRKGYKLDTWVTE